MDAYEEGAKKKRAALNRAGGKLSFRRTTYRGQEGIGLYGHGPTGARVKMFAHDWHEMHTLIEHADTFWRYSVNLETES